MTTIGLEYISDQTKGNEMEKYNGRTREEAIQWRMEVYGEFYGVAEAKVDEDYNGRDNTEPSDNIDWLFSMLNATYC